MNKFSSLLCFFLLGTSALNAMNINEIATYNGHAVKYETFCNTDLKAIIFTSNKDLTFIGKPFERSTNLKYLAFTAENQKIVTVNGIKDSATLSPSEDLGTSVDCKIVKADDINKMKSSIDYVSNLKIVIPESAQPVSTVNLPTKDGKKSVQKKSKPEKIIKVRSNADILLDNIKLQLVKCFDEHIHGKSIDVGNICQRITDNLYTLFGYSYDISEEDVVNQKFRTLCKIINPTTPAVLLRSIDLGDCRLSFSLSDKFKNLIIIDNKLPIEDDNCRIRFIRSDIKDWVLHVNAIKEQVLNDPTNRKVRFLTCVKVHL